MRSAPLPPDEAERLATLERYAVLDTPPEEAFEAIARVVRALFDAPIALVSLIDRDRQWFKASQGFDFRETSREVAFCPHVVHGRAPLYVPDTYADVRFDDNELVTRGPGVRFYCGVPLFAPDGTIPGTLDVLDTRPRPDITTDQIERLEDLATTVVTLLEHRLALIQARAQEPELALRRRLVEVLHDRADMGIVLTDTGGRIQQANARVTRWLEVDQQALAGRQWRHWLESAAGTGAMREARLRVAGGERMPVRHAVERIRISPEQDYLLHTLEDLRTEHAERALQHGRAEVLARIARRAEPERTLRRLAELPALSDPEAVGYVLVYRDGGEPLALAPGMARRGYPSQARPGALVRALLSLEALAREGEDGEPSLLAPLERHGPDLAWLAFAARLRAAIATPLRSQEETVLGSVGILMPLRRAQAVEPLQAELSEMSQLAAITLQHSHMLEQLRWQAYHDDLTGLGNRTLLRERLGAALEAADPVQEQVAVFLFDLDRFKEVNDQLGHAAGDRVLREVSERLRAILRAGDVCCRVGGDEFVVFTPVARLEDARRLAAKIMQAAQLSPKETGATPVAASVGVALYPEHGREVEALLDAADRAMYRAKRAGGDRWELPATM